MIHRIFSGDLGVVAIACAVATASVSPATADPGLAGDGAAVEAKRVIAQHCAQCHPPLPDGAGWVLMTETRRARAGWVSELRRMDTDYQARLADAQRRVLLDYLTQAWGPGDDG